MKIEQLLAQHFYNQKEITLQGIGTFTLSPDLVMPTESDKDATLPDNAISFKYDSRATEDDALINYIVEQTRKMKPLAAADLDSYLVLGKQFLNIGKPFRIEGIGMLIKNQQGEYQFTQGQNFGSKPEDTTPAVVKEKTDDNDISFRDESRAGGKGNKGLRIAAAVLVVGMLGAAAWYFFIRDTKPAAVETALQEPVVKQEADTNKIVTPAPPDSLNAVKKDSAVAPPPVAAGSYAFKVVFRVMSQGGALKKKIELNKSNVIMYTSDSVHYKLAEGFNRPFSDTTKIKDSLRAFYAFRTFIEY